MKYKVAKVFLVIGRCKLLCCSDHHMPEMYMQHNLFFVVFFFIKAYHKECISCVCLDICPLQLFWIS